MLLMVEKEIIGGICHSIHRYAKANNKCMKKYDKDMEYYISNIQMQAICMDGQCLQNFYLMVLNGYKSYLNLTSTS